MAPEMEAEWNLEGAQDILLFIHAHGVLNYDFEWQTTFSGVCRSERDEKCDSNILKMADIV